MNESGIAGSDDIIDSHPLPPLAEGDLRETSLRDLARGLARGALSDMDFRNDGLEEMAPEEEEDVVCLGIGCAKPCGSKEVILEDDPNRDPEDGRALRTWDVKFNGKGVLEGGAERDSRGIRDFHLEGKREAPDLVFDTRFRCEENREQGKGNVGFLFESFPERYDRSARTKPDPTRLDKGNRSFLHSKYASSTETLTQRFLRSKNQSENGSASEFGRMVERHDRFSSKKPSLPFYDLTSLESYAEGEEGSGSTKFIKSATGNDISSLRSFHGLSARDNVRSMLQNIATNLHSASPNHKNHPVDSANKSANVIEKQTDDDLKNMEIKHLFPLPSVPSSDAYSEADGYPFKGRKTKYCSRETKFHMPFGNPRSLSSFPIRSVAEDLPISETEKGKSPKDEVRAASSNRDAGLRNHGFLHLEHENLLGPREREIFNAENERNKELSPRSQCLEDERLARRLQEEFVSEFNTGRNKAGNGVSEKTDLKDPYQIIEQIKSDEELARMLQAQETERESRFRRRRRDASSQNEDATLSFLKDFSSFQSQSDESIHVRNGFDSSENPTGLVSILDSESPNREESRSSLFSRVDSLFPTSSLRSQSSTLPNRQESRSAENVHGNLRTLRGVRQPEPTSTFGNDNRQRTAATRRNRTSDTDRALGEDVNVVIRDAMAELEGTEEINDTSSRRNSGERRLNELDSVYGQVRGYLRSPDPPILSTMRDLTSENRARERDRRLSLLRVTRPSVNTSGSTEGESYNRIRSLLRSHRRFSSSLRNREQEREAFRLPSSDPDPDYERVLSRASTRLMEISPSLDLDQRIELLDRLESAFTHHFPIALRLATVDRDFNESDYETLLQLDEIHGSAANIGASEHKIDQLPLSIVQAHEASKEGCSICLEDNVEGESIRRLPCFHFFHQQCIDLWLKRQAVCPICKRHI